MVGLVVVVGVVVVVFVSVVLVRAIADCIVVEGEGGVGIFASICVLVVFSAGSSVWLSG